MTEWLNSYVFFQEKPKVIRAGEQVSLSVQR